MTKPIKCKVVYNKDNITETLGEVLEKQTKLKLELQRLKSITLLFFSGGREPFIGESRILKKSPKVATYDLQRNECL
jgi:2,3-bisphosphoglycerate-independent phosphoglycerate mutase